MLAVFWACLIAASNLQMYIPQFIVLAEGKFSIASLLGLVTEPFTIPLCLYYRDFPPSPKNHTFQMFWLNNVLILPDLPSVLKDISLFLQPTKQRSLLVYLFLHRTTLDEDV